MKPLAIPSVQPSALAALDRALGQGGASALDPAMPAALWRRALAGPAAEFLARPGKGLRTMIVRAGWMLGGGAPAAMNDRLPLVLELLHAGSLIIDDVEDGSLERRGAPALHHLIGAPLAINTGSWMYFWALAELAELGLPPAVELAAHRVATAALVRCHQGQALDLATRITALDAGQAASVVDLVTRLKTGSLCALAGDLGAIAAGAGPRTRVAIAGFAETVGIALQMFDDLVSITSPGRRDKGREDLCSGRPTWPWAWLAKHDSFEWARFTAMARTVIAGDGDADQLADALAEAVAPAGRAHAKATLSRALAELTRAIGPSPVVEIIAQDLREMEDTYG